MRLGTVAWRGEQRAAIFKEKSVELLECKSATEALSGEVPPWKEVNYKEIIYLPPITAPQKIVCIGLNYRDHAKELIKKGMLSQLPERMVFFLKPPSALLGHEQRIQWPNHPDVKRVDYEAELAIVIKERCRDVAAKEAGDFIFGYSCFNDVTARNVQEMDVQWTRAKSFDTFAPLGPWIVDGGSMPKKAKIGCRVNGKAVQSSHIGEMLFPPEKIVEFASSVMTLQPGDVIATGTPAGVGELRPGDVVEVDVEGIGVLRNGVVKEAKAEF